MIQPAHGTSRQLQLAHAHPRVEAPDLPSRAHARVWARVPPRLRLHPPLRCYRACAPWAAAAPPAACARAAPWRTPAACASSRRAPQPGTSPLLARVLLRGARRSQPCVRAGGMRACAGEGSHLAERARLRLPHERRARIAADHAGGVIAAQRRDRARLGRRLGWLRDLPDARRASASVPGRRRARSAAHRLRARAGRRRAAIAAGIQHFGEHHRRFCGGRAGLSRLLLQSSKKT